uniref:Uncharacterized protein n=1 Tax=Anguilla anguilla TaxID=7936 RepID=A0A0E9STH0_ANGAN
MPFDVLQASVCFIIDSRKEPFEGLSLPGEEVY